MTMRMCGMKFDVSLNGDRMSIYFRNITETVLSRQRLEEAHDRLREQSELLDKAQDAIFVQDMESHILYWNRGRNVFLGGRRRR